MATVTLYAKPGCCLCDDAREVVKSVLDTRSVELQEVDVSLDPGLDRDYGERIPVLAIDGDEAFEHRVEARALEDLLDRIDA